MKQSHSDVLSFPEEDSTWHDNQRRNSHTLESKEFFMNALQKDSNFQRLKAGL